MTFQSKRVGSLPRPPAQRETSGNQRVSRMRLSYLAPLITLLSLLGLCIAPVATIAIESPYSSADAQAAEQATAEEFAAFSAPTRRAALVVAGYPESLLEIQRLQQDSADRFGALVASYPRETQAQIWDLVRYPGLAADLARGGKKSAKELEDLADRYPEANHTAILEEGTKRHDLWVQIYSLDLESRQSLSTILAAEPAEVQAAFDEVTARPDLMSLLVENIQWTTLQGAAYRENPAKVDAQFGTLAAQVAARRQAAEADWANEVTDPEAAEELEIAAREFADEYGYDFESELAAASKASNSTTTIIVEQRVNPYPYWFGYPTWYDSAFWYPLSFASHIGFGYGYGYGYGGGFGFGRYYASYGLPSPFFLGWYHDIYRPRHARHHRNGRAHRRSIRYYDHHRPHRSASHRRHRRGGDHVSSLSDRARAERRRIRNADRHGGRRGDTRDGRYEFKRDRRGHADALANRALAKQRRSSQTDRRRDSRTDRREQRARGERRDARNLRSPLREQSRFTRIDSGRNGHRDRRATREQRANQGKRKLRSDRRERNPAIRPGNRPAERLAERKNDGVRKSANFRQARADVPGVSKPERKTERRVERKARKAERRVARSERKAAKRIARADRKASRNRVHASSGGDQRRMKAAKQSSRPQRAVQRNRSGGSRKAQRQGGGGRRGGSRGHRGNRN